MPNGYSQDDYDPLQNSLRKFLLGFFSLIGACLVGFGVLWAVTEFGTHPELQTMPDQYGNVWPLWKVGLIILGLIVGGVWIWNRVHSDLETKD